MTWSRGRGRRWVEHQDIFWRFAALVNFPEGRPVRIERVIEGGEEGRGGGEGRWEGGGWEARERRKDQRIFPSWREKIHEKMGKRQFPSVDQSPYLHPRQFCKKIGMGG